MKNKLFENPDTVYDVKSQIEIDFQAPGAYPFAYIKNKLYVGGEGVTHEEIADVYNDYPTFKFTGRDNLKYAGRIWTNEKIISFWEYPTKSTLKKILKDLEKYFEEHGYKLNFLGKKHDWKIDIIVKLPDGRFPRYVDKIVFLDEYLNTKKTSKPRSKEELKIQHLDMSKKHEVPYGYGSKNPKYMTKRKWQMASATDEGSKEIFYPKLFETPDYIALNTKGKKYFWFDETPSYSFNFDDEGNARVGKKWGTHVSLEGARDDANYSGRIFTKHKIISFWYYPPKEKMESLIRSLEEKMRINIWDDPEYKVEIIPEAETYTPEDYEYNERVKDDWANKKLPVVSSFEPDEYQHVYIPLKQYVGSKARSKEELAIQHLDTSKKHEVPYGYGSKNPKYMEKRKWQMASMTDESFYPKLKEGVADKYAEKKFHIIDPDTEFEHKYHNEQLKNDDKDKIVVKLHNKIFIVKNPTTLENFPPEVRAVMSKTGNIYVLNANYKTHTDILFLLKEVNELPTDPKDDRWWLKLPNNFLTLQRKGNTNTFMLGESNEPMFDSIAPERRQHYNLPSYKKCVKIYDSYLEAARKKHSNFKFENKVFNRRDSDVNEGAAMDKYMFNQFGIAPHQDYIGENDSRAVAFINTVYRGISKKIPIIKNPKNLNDFDHRARAISDKKGNLYVALNNGEFNHGMMGNTLINKGIIDTIWYNEDADSMSDYEGIYDDQKNFLLLNVNKRDDSFIESDTFIWEGDYTIDLVKALKLKNPQFKYDIFAYNKYGLEFPGDERVIDESLILESPDGFNFIDNKYYSVDNKYYNPSNKKTTGKTYSIEVILNRETNSIEDVLIASRANVYHGDDAITNGPISGQPGDSVSDDRPKLKYKFPWEKIYPGRLYMTPKVITFWVYPNTEEMKDIITIINKKLKIDMIKDGWHIEVYEDGLERKGAKRYDNNYNRHEDSYFIPVAKYVGSNKPPEKEYLQHLDTKTKHKVPYGYGSKNPKYQSKRQWQMASVTDEGKEENLYPKLFETPDTVLLPDSDTYMSWSGAPNYAFGIKKGKLLVGDPFSKHYELASNASRENLSFPGRIWPTKYVISFWVYPPKDKFKKIIDSLEKELDIEIWNDDRFKVEVIRKVSSKEIKTSKKGTGGNGWNEWDDDEFKIDHVSPKNYIGSEDVPKEMRQKIQHLDMSKKHEVPYGYGSKNPKYMEKRKWQMASATDENKKEIFYPKLFESPDSAKLPNGHYVKYGDYESYPFGYYDGKFYIKSVEIHDDLPSRVPRQQLKYPGRLWKREKLISFWIYPSPEEFKEIINKINEALDINIWDDPQWLVEIVKKDDNKISLGGEFGGYYDKGKWEENNISIGWVHPLEYTGSEQRSKKELAMQHLDTKNKHSVPFGYGSKNPKYMEKRKWQMASATDESSK